MIEQAVGRIAHRPNHREAVIDLSELRQQFGELHAWQLRINWLEDALHIIRDARFWIPEIQVRGTTLQIAHDDVLGLAPTGSPCGQLSGVSFELQHGTQRQTEHSRATHTQHVAA